jgi:hypothetical protein
MSLTTPGIELPQRYRVLRHVATGGMASVYAATDELLGRDVAIKVLAPAFSADDSARARFTREARAAARVSDHPHVVTIYDIAETDDDPPVAFIVMELLPGGTIGERLKAGEPIPHTLAIRWLEQTADALDAAHATGMVHRDVKPANLLLDAQGTLKVADFGIATIGTEAPLTMTGQVVGTAAYFSPEQALGKPATDASDRYALAVVAFELLTGRRPFPPGAPAAQAMAHVETDPPHASTVAPGLPPAVDEVLARGLAKDPAARPATARDLVAQLHGALGPTAATGVARPVPVPTETVVKARTPRTPRPEAQRFTKKPDPVPVRSQPAKNRAGRLAAAAAILLVAGAGVAALATGGGDKPAADHPATTAKKHVAAKPKPTTTNAATTPPATTATPAPAPAPASGAPADAAAIQSSAHSALGQGDYNGAIQQLNGLVNRCDVKITDPCAYAWFDLGYALRRAGAPGFAVPVLEHRLQNPDQSATVQAELDAARTEAEAAGQHPGKAPKGHGHFKPGKGD